MKTVLPILAALTYGPGDAARACAESAFPVLEIVTFQLVDGTDVENFLNAAQATETMLRDHGSLVRRFLTMDETGVWTDVIEWTSKDEALAAAEAAMQHPDFAPFGSMIDTETLHMRHAPILWRME